MNDPSQISGAEVPEMPPAAVFSPGFSQLPAALAADAAEPGPILLLVNAADDPIWAADAAIEIASHWARAGRRVVLADLHFEEPILHTRLGESNLDGVVDIFLYGASVARSARPPRDHGFFLIPAGTYTATPEDVYGHPRWNKLVAGFREAGATLLAFVPGSAAGVERLAEYSEGAVLLGRAGAVAAPVLSGESVRAVLVPSAADLETASAAADAQAGGEVEAEQADRASFEDTDGNGVFGSSSTEDSELDTLDPGQGGASPGWRDEFVSDDVSTAEEFASSASAEADREKAFDAEADALPEDALEPDVEALPVEASTDDADVWAEDRHEWSLEPPEAERLEPDTADPFSPSPAELEAAPQERDEFDHELLALGGTEGEEPDPFAADRSRTGAPELTDAEPPERTADGAAEEWSAEPMTPEVERKAGDLGDSWSREPGTPDARAVTADGAESRDPAPAAAAASAGLAADHTDEIGARLAPPAPQPLISPSRRKRRSGPGPMIWLLVGAATLILAVLVAAMLRPDLFGGVRGPGGGNPAQDTLAAGARVPPAPLTPMPVGDTLAYTVQIRAYASLPPAQTQLERQARRVPEAQFYIVPELTQGVLYYKVMAGTLRDTAAGTALRQRLVDAGVIAAADARDDAFGSWSLIQARPLTYQLGEFVTRDEAVARADSLSARGIPSYPLALPYSDGTRRWRVYGGAYADSLQAAEFGTIIREAQLPARLVARLGQGDPSMP